MSEARTHAAGTIEVTSWEPQRYDELDGAATLVVIEVTELFRGDIVGDGRARMLQALRRDGSATLCGPRAGHRRRGGTQRLFHLPRRRHPRLDGGRERRLVRGARLGYGGAHRAAGGGFVRRRRGRERSHHTRLLVRVRWGTAGPVRGPVAALGVVAVQLPASSVSWSGRRRHSSCARERLRRSHASVLVSPPPENFAPTLTSAEIRDAPWPPSRS
jgi:hypothetical protein